MGLPKFHTDQELNTIRGKNLVGAATKEDVEVLFEHLDAIEVALDEADSDDVFGTEGWRHFFGLED